METNKISYMRDEIVENEVVCNPIQKMRSFSSIVSPLEQIELKSPIHATLHP